MRGMDDNGRKKIAYILKNYPETRGDDKLLYATFLEVHHNARTRMNNASSPYDEWLRIMTEAISYTTIIRTRRLIQSEDFCLASNVAGRKQAEKSVKKYVKEVSHYKDKMNEVGSPDNDPFSDKEPMISLSDKSEIEKIDNKKKQSKILTLF